MIENIYSRLLITFFPSHSRKIAAPFSIIQRKDLLSCTTINISIHIYLLSRTTINVYIHIYIFSYTAGLNPRVFQALPLTKKTRLLCSHHSLIPNNAAYLHYVSGDAGLLTVNEIQHNIISSLESADRDGAPQTLHSVGDFRQVHSRQESRETCCNDRSTFLVNDNYILLSSRVRNTLNPTLVPAPPERELPSSPLTLLFKRPATS